jgi:hypothetical protein
MFIWLFQMSQVEMYRLDDSCIDGSLLKSSKTIASSERPANDQANLLASAPFQFVDDHTCASTTRIYRLALARSQPDKDPSSPSISDGQCGRPLCSAGDTCAGQRRSATGRLGQMRLPSLSDITCQSRYGYLCRWRRLFPL